MKTKITLVAFLLLCINAAHSSELEIPYLTGRVNDNAGILAMDIHLMLGDSLKAHEYRTTNQIVVLTIASLQGESIEDYAHRVFNEWKLGQKEKNNGILILIAPNDRQMRIEVGYGLEATLTDLTTARIIRNIMTPRFREGDYNGGITEGTMAVIHLLDGKSTDEITGLEEEETSASGSGIFSMEDSGLSIMERILIGAFVFGIIGLFTILGIVTPGFGWFLYLFLIPFWAMFPIVVLGTKGAFICFIAYLILFPAAKLYLKSKPWYKSAQSDLRTKGTANIGGFTFSSGTSGGSSWSSGSSGSSFSGGGGSSGGGGASGSW